MRCKYERVLPIIHLQLNREPQEDEAFITMSKLYLFSYLNNNHYDIDNSIAERFIRPLTVNASIHCSLLETTWKMYHRSINTLLLHAE